MASSVHVIARRFPVSPSTVLRLWKRFQETGSYSKSAGQGLIHHQVLNPSAVLVSPRLSKKNTVRALEYELQTDDVSVSDKTINKQTA